jgi:hypothetical protein
MRNRQALPNRERIPRRPRRLVDRSHPKPRRSQARQSLARLASRVRRPTRSSRRGRAAKGDERSLCHCSTRRRTRTCTRRRRTARWNEDKLLPCTGGRTRHPDRKPCRRWCSCRGCIDLRGRTTSRPRTRHCSTLGRTSRTRTSNRTSRRPGSILGKGWGRRCSGRRSTSGRARICHKRRRSRRSRRTLARSTACTSRRRNDSGLPRRRPGQPRIPRSRSRCRTSPRCRRTTHCTRRYTQAPSTRRARGRRGWARPPRARRRPLARRPASYRNRRTPRGAPRARKR